MPALHGFVHNTLAETHSNRSKSVPNLPASKSTCPICDFVRAAIPVYAAAEPLLMQSDIVSDISFPVLIPSVVRTIALPLCRAPPVL